MTASDSNIETDLLVIGGGITGVGIAQDAAARGLRTVLVEKGDFAGGTSSKSSKQIHGGLRYLEHFSLGLMCESISERHTLTRLAPGLVRWRPFLIPYFQGRSKKWKTRLGLWLYDHLARSEPELRHRGLTSDEILSYAPQLRRKELLGGALFYDCITDDARLVLSIALDAQVRGARVFNYLAVKELIQDEGRVTGVVARDALTGEAREIRARQVVSATGAWTDQTLGMLGESQRESKIRPAKGVHIVLPRRRLELDHVVLIPSARDRRFLFVIPWYEGIVIGTTDTEYRAAPDAVRPEPEDVGYILDAINWSFPDARVVAGDIVSSYAGIRPLINAPGKNTADVPREYKIFESGSGIIAVAGGKLTTYRVMAKTVTDRVVARLSSGEKDRALLPCWTHRIPLGNPPDDGFDPFSRIDLPEDIRAHLLADYGTWARQIVSILEVSPQWARRISPGLPYILAEAYFAVTREKARTLEDVLARRTRVALLAPDQGLSSAAEVCEIMAGELKWSAEEKQKQLQAYKEFIKERLCGAAVFGNDK
jgi:glycerol-3-phosphate dehydrogenase